MSSRIYFDMTDIVRYAVSNDRVSGIQRVQFNLIGHLSRKYGGEIVRCVFHHSDELGMVEIDPAPLFEAGEYHSSRLLQQLGLEEPRKIFPPRSKLKSYLRRYNANKPLRALKKIDVLASALFMPWRLAALGLQPQTRTYPSLKLTPAGALPEGAHYVVLSVNTSDERVHGFARQHVQRGGDMVQLVYDLIPHVCPRFFTSGMVDIYRAWLNELVKMSPRVICISEWTARDLRQYIGEPASKWDIRSIPLAHELDGFERNAEVVLSAADSARLPKQPYVLCVGTLEVRKNGVSLLRAWSRLLADIGEAAPTLVFAGKHGWLIEEFEAVLKSDPLLSKKVQIVDSPSDRQLAWLYQHCMFTVYPSYYEGWGLPVGESAWFGKYCIASHASSLPEVCGDLIDYVDPNDPNEITQKVLAALNDPARIASLEKCIGQASLRRWSDVAEDIFRLVMAPEPVSSPVLQTAGSAS